jgi:hypothetical protein
MVSEPNNVDYYARREQRERELAARSADPHVAMIHHELADRYASYVQSPSTPAVLMIVPR